MEVIGVIQDLAVEIEAVIAEALLALLLAVPIALAVAAVLSVSSQPVVLVPGQEPLWPAPVVFPAATVIVPA
ncbi:hypothetical protein [Vulcanisaeta sp. JCM 16159]|uniref:hypothetical protein n=1 Tax=Vulcanisaeta sp. JCM 16159 TaxID=1295371 RepID=UPI000B1DFFAA|nr:hypothetical protein [Vulcanisaeta sp. JCM 16159]